MSIGKFLHINIIMLIVSLVMDHACYASEVQLHNQRPEQQPIEERFTQHPIASYVVAALFGGVGAKLFTADSHWCKAASLVPLTLASVFITNEQIAQRLAQHPKFNLKSNEVIAINQRPSRWWFAVPPLVTAGLVAALSARNNSWLQTLFWSAAAGAIPAGCARLNANIQKDQDYVDEYNYKVAWNRMGGILSGNLKNAEEIREAVQILDHDDVQKNIQSMPLTVSQVDNVMGMLHVLEREKRPDNTKSIELLNSIKPNPKETSEKQFSGLTIEDLLYQIDAETNDDDNNSINHLKNDYYTEIENTLLQLQKMQLEQEGKEKKLTNLLQTYSKKGSLKKHPSAEYAEVPLWQSQTAQLESELLRLQQNSKKNALKELFVKYPKLMNLILDEYEKRTVLHSNIGENIFLRDRDHVMEFVKEAKTEAQNEQVESYHQQLNENYKKNAEYITSLQEKGDGDQVLENLFADYPDKMDQLLENYKEETVLYKKIGKYHGSRDRVTQFMQQAQKEAKAQKISAQLVSDVLQLVLRKKPNKEAEKEKESEKEEQGSEPVINFV